MTDPVTYVLTADDVTEEVLALAWAAATVWPEGQDKGVHWARFWPKLNGVKLADGTTLHLGGMLCTKAMYKIKDYVVERSAEEGLPQ